MKKKPINKYAKETGRVPIVGTMAAESSLRTSTWLKYGCNAFDNKKAISAPLSFWTDKTTDTQNTVYHREWAREVDVAWHGKQQDTLEIRMMLCGTAVLAAVRRNGSDDPKFIRDYTSPKRAMNAARELVTFAGFEW